MDLDKVIESRRSVREYAEKEIPFEKIILLLNAANHTPSAGNLQTFSFVVVNDKDKKNKIAEASLKQFWMNQAPIFIVICSDIQKLETYYKERGTKYADQNAGATAMLIELKAADLGLASCWVNVFDQERVSKILNITSGIVPKIIITLGYEINSKIKQIPKARLSKITSFNKYGNKIADLKNWAKEKYSDKIRKLIKKYFQ